MLVRDKRFSWAKIPKADMNPEQGLVRTAQTAEIQLELAINKMLSLIGKAHERTH
jgi:hypothetical protein